MNSLKGSASVRHEYGNISSKLSACASSRFTGGEPLLNYPLLLEAISQARYYRIPSRFVETNGFWCMSESRVKTQLLQLRKAGLDGVLISVNPFVIEYVPFRRIQRAIDITQQRFGQRLMIYQPYFYEVFIVLGFKKL